MDTTHPYKTTATKTVYKNPWIRVREDAIIMPNGKPGIYGVMESSDSVMTVVLNDKQRVYLVYAYSYPDQSWNWELPGGGGDGEDPVAASKRELLEETGIIAQDWTLLGKTRVCNGLMTERQSTYLARNITFTGKKNDQDKAIVADGAFYDWSEVQEMINDGKINDNQSIAGLYLAERWLRAEQEVVDRTETLHDNS